MTSMGERPMRLWSYCTKTYSRIVDKIWWGLSDSNTIPYTFLFMSSIQFFLVNCYQCDSSLLIFKVEKSLTYMIYWAKHTIVIRTYLQQVFIYTIMLNNTLKRNIACHPLHVNTPLRQQEKFQKYFWTLFLKSFIDLQIKFWKITWNVKVHQSGYQLTFD